METCEPSTPSLARKIKALIAICLLCATGCNDAMGQADISFRGTVGSTSVNASGRSGETQCVDIGGYTTLVMHHIDWAGDGSEALRDLGLAVSLGSPYLVRLGILEGEEFTEFNDLQREILHYPSLLNVVLDPVSEGLIVESHGKAARLDAMSIADPGDEKTRSLLREQ